MFNNCKNLKYVDISNFNASLVTMLFGLFYNCTNLEYINFGNFIEGKFSSFQNNFYNIPDNIVYCINNEEKMPSIMGELKNMTCSVNDCSSNWKLVQKIKIIQKNKCVNSCKEDDTYFYTYQNKCYNNCPNGTKLTDEINYL